MKKIDGFYRPKNCKRTFCENYGMNGCSLNPEFNLDKPINDWKVCFYFERRSFESKQKKEYYDAIYARIASYKDSHSAVWKGQREE